MQEAKAKNKGKLLESLVMEETKRTIYRFRTITPAIARAWLVSLRWVAGECPPDVRVLDLPVNVILVRLVSSSTSLLRVFLRILIRCLRTAT
eukprot:COSAG05_NODE_97_length_19444_cov_8.577174_4_plen_92_part_00